MFIFNVLKQIPTAQQMAWVQSQTFGPCGPWATWTCDGVGLYLYGPVLVWACADIDGLGLHGSRACGF